jgi:hypothetical protein
LIDGDVDLDLDGDLDLDLDGDVDLDLDGDGDGDLVVTFDESGLLFLRNQPPSGVDNMAVSRQMRNDWFRPRLVNSRPGVPSNLAPALGQPW